MRLSLTRDHGNHIAPNYNKAFEGQRCLQVLEFGPAPVMAYLTDDCDDDRAKLMAGATELATIVRRFIQDVEAAYPDARTGESFPDAWFDLSLTYRDAKNRLEDAGIDLNQGE